jgi:hypothetical protein
VENAAQRKRGHFLRRYCASALFFKKVLRKRTIF